jgi:hypothetical protein
MAETREHLIERLKAIAQKKGIGCLRYFVIGWINDELEKRHMPPLTDDEEQEI